MSNPLDYTNFLNSPAWQTFQQEYGFATVLKDCNLFIAKKALIFPYYLASRVVFENEAQISDAFKTLDKPVFIRIAPEDDSSFALLKKYCETQNLPLKKQASFQPKQTLVVDLEKEMDQILSEMKQKHRYNLKLAQKKELKFEIYSENLEKYFERFWLLHADTASRQDFHTHPKAYYQKMIEVLEKEKMVHIGFVSSKEGLDLATTMMITYKGIATYLHGGSHKDHKELMAPYLLHFESMKFAKELGFQKYDFWGINAKPVEDPTNLNSSNWTYFDKHPSAGTTRFKLGFGGSIINYPGTFDLVLDRYKYSAYQLIKKLKQRKGAFN